MTQLPVALSSTTALVDLSAATTGAYGTSARKAINGVMALWAGNSLPDHVIRYVGFENDRDPLLQRIGGIVPTNTVNGYHMEDLNADGSVKYVGLNNDRDIILQNIGGVIPTNTRPEQLP
jgi:hypothetical protein